MILAGSLRRYLTRRHVRPWALCAPILILIIAIPIQRPLRTPDPSLISDDEQSRLATIQAIVEHHSLAIEGTDFRDTRAKIVAIGDIGEKFPTHFYSKQSPMLAVLLSGPYWVMHRFGLTFSRDPSSTVFWLTLLGITLPVALSAGFVYRMSRIFELQRPLRAMLALIAVVGSGLISYATVINAHAPAAVLLLGAATLLIHVITHTQASRSAGWLGLAGLCAALAAAIDPPAVIFLVLFLLVIAAFRWTIWTRAIGIALYILGAALPIAVHAELNRSITGDIKPGIFHPELAVARLAKTRQTSMQLSDEDDDEPQTPWRSFKNGSYRVWSAFVGWHGILSTFPVMVLGIMGVTLIMHRHWPAATKMLAGTTLAGALAVILIYALSRTTTRDAMFATRWFIVFLPLTIFWAGAWLRRPHRRSSWILAGVLLAYSVSASLIGATGPLPREGFDRYPVVGALHNFTNPAPPPTLLSPIADRGNQDAFGE